MGRTLPTRRAGLKLVAAVSVHSKVFEILPVTTATPSFPEPPGTTIVFSVTLWVVCIASACGRKPQWLVSE